MLCHDGVIHKNKPKKMDPHCLLAHTRVIRLDASPVQTPRLEEEVWRRRNLKPEIKDSLGEAN